MRTDRRGNRADLFGGSGRTCRLDAHRGRRRRRGPLTNLFSKLQAEADDTTPLDKTSEDKVMPPLLESGPLSLIHEIRAIAADNPIAAPNRIRDAVAEAGLATHDVSPEVGPMSNPGAVQPTRPPHSCMRSTLSTEPTKYLSRWVATRWSGRSPTMPLELCVEPAGAVRAGSDPRPARGAAWPASRRPRRRRAVADGPDATV